MRRDLQLGIALLAILVCFLLIVVYRSISSLPTAGNPLAITPTGANEVTLTPSATTAFAITPTVASAVTPTPSLTIHIAVTPTVTSQTTPSTVFTASGIGFVEGSVVTGVTKDGEPIIITTELLVERLDSGEIIPGDFGRVRVSRAGSVSYLRALVHPGCNNESECAEQFVMYDGASRLVDMDSDGEPEILSTWFQGGSGAISSFHVHRWDGSQYQELAEASAQLLTAEIQDLNGDGRPELVVRFNTPPHRFHIPWVDVYALSGDRLALVNSQYPQFYRELLAEYDARMPEYTALATALTSQGASDEIASDEIVVAMKELELRKEMARALIE